LPVLGLATGLIVVWGEGVLIFCAVRPREKRLQQRFDLSLNLRPGRHTRQVFLRFRSGLPSEVEAIEALKWCEKVHEKRLGMAIADKAG
jgi:hypothetical protein